MNTSSTMTAPAASVESPNLIPSGSHDDLPSSLPPIACKPWCESSDGHTSAKHPEDQYCEGPGVFVPLSQRKMVRYYEEPLWRMDAIEVHVVERNGRSVVELNDETHGTNASTVALTPSEARTMAAALISVAEVAEGE